MDTGAARMTVDEARRLMYLASAPDRMIEDKLYADCCKIVRAAAIQQKADVVFNLPVMQFGLPRYNCRLMRDKLAARLMREGWAVGAVDEQSLRVGWTEGARPAPANRTISARGKKR